jgi:hypothetical protein
MNRKTARFCYKAFRERMAELEAAVAVLPARRDELREMYDAEPTIAGWAGVEVKPRARETSSSSSSSPPPRPDWLAEDWSSRGSRTQLIAGVMAEAGTPLSVRQIAEGLAAKGHLPGGAKYQLVYNYIWKSVNKSPRFERDGRGRYRLRA